MNQSRPPSDCTISSALDIFGDKWSLLVMRDLLFRNKLHYRDFLASEEGIATNILADRLARLEQAGLVEKTDDDPRSGKQAYFATPKGTDLIPLLLQMMLWSAEHNPQTAAPGALIRDLKADLAKAAQGNPAGGIQAFIESL